MIIWGSGGDIVELGHDHVRDCPVCGQERPFSITLQYTYGHLYYIFGWVKSREYLLACRVCRRGQLLDPQRVQQQIGGDPIPFMRRFGIPIFAVALVALVLLFQFAPSTQRPAHFR